MCWVPAATVIHTRYVVARHSQEHKSSVRVPCLQTRSGQRRKDSFLAFDIIQNHQADESARHWLEEFFTRGGPVAARELTIQPSTKKGNGEEFFFTHIHAEVFPSHVFEALQVVEHALGKSLQPVASQISAHDECWTKAYRTDRRLMMRQDEHLMNGQALRRVGAECRPSTLLYFCRYGLAGRC